MGGEGEPFGLWEVACRSSVEEPKSTGDFRRFPEISVDHFLRKGEGRGDLPEISGDFRRFPEIFGDFRRFSGRQAVGGRGLCQDLCRRPLGGSPPSSLRRLGQQCSFSLSGSPCSRSLGWEAIPVWFLRAVLTMAVSPWSVGCAFVLGVWLTSLVLVAWKPSRRVLPRGSVKNVSAAEHQEPFFLFRAPRLVLVCRDCRVSPSLPTPACGELVPLSPRCPL